MKRQIKFVIWFPIVLVTAFTAGYLFWQKTLVPGPFDLEPVNIVRNQNESLDTNNWQTYRNKEYGFEVKYPSDWGWPTMTSGNLLFGCPGTDNTGGDTCVLVVSFKEKQNAGKKVANYTNCPFVHGASFVREKYVINFRGCMEIYQNNDTYTQILSTFKFIGD